MKKILSILAFAIAPFLANAYEFDSIDLNAPYMKVTQEISKRGYVYNQERNCLMGDCHGVQIFLGINYVDVKTAGQVGQLIVEVPVKADETNLMEHAVMLFNVVYHQIDSKDGHKTYSVDKDGTEMVLSQKEGYLVITYNTPYYKKARK